MSPAKLARLVGIGLRRDKKGAIFSVFGVAVGIGALVFFVALGNGAGSLVRHRILPVDLQAVEVIPPTFSLNSLLGGNKLDEATAARLAAIPGVERLFRKMELRVPAMGGPADSLTANLGIPRNIYIAVIAIGVEPELVAPDLVTRGSFVDSPAGKPVPAIAARRLLELYNHSLAKSQGLPTLAEPLLKAAAGVELLTVRLGRSMRGETGLPEQPLGLSYAGLSDRAPLHGVLIPLESVRRIHREYGLDANSFSSFTLIAKSPDAVPSIIQEVRRMGLAVDEGDKKLAERIGAVVAVITSVLALLSVLICMLAAVNIAHSLSASVRSRSKELAVLRAVGATRGDVWRLVLGEAGIIGLAGGTAGVLAARLTALFIDAVARVSLPDFPFKPETFFSFSPTLLAGAIALGIFASFLGAYLPALTASRIDPARALAE